MHTSVYIHRRPNFRSAEMEMVLEIGRNTLEKMFDHRICDKKCKMLTLYFPERYLNIIERRQLMTDAIPKCLPNLQILEIHTHCPILIGEFNNEDCKLFDEDVPLRNKKWGEKVCTTFKKEIGLQVFKG